MRIKKFKEKFEESTNLRKEVKYLLDHIQEYQNGVLVNNQQDEVLRERVIGFDEMFEYLNKDPEFKI